MRRAAGMALALAVSCASHAGTFEVGVSAVDITPYDFEERPVDPAAKKAKYKAGDPFRDTGTDQRYSFEESGAFGADGRPGIARKDDDGNGVVDDCPRENLCPEYLAKGSDDRKDPAGDDRSPSNKAGTEKDRRYQAYHLAGFGPYTPPAIARTRMSAGVLDPIWARALAFRGSNDVTMIWIATDLPGLTWKFINPVRRQLSARLGVPVANILIGSNHDHQAPDGSGYWETLNPGHGVPYARFVMKRMLEAGAAAFASLRPAKMKSVTTTHDACVDRETGALKRDPDCKVPYLEYEMKRIPADWDELILQRDGRDPVVRNTAIVAAQLVDAGSGETIATLLNYSDHPESLKSENQLLSSDYVHFVRQYLEQHLGGTAVFLLGTQGSQIGAGDTRYVLWNECAQRQTDAGGRPRLSRERGLTRIRSMGYEIAWEAVKALEAETTWQTDVAVQVKTERELFKVTNVLHVIGTRHVWLRDVEELDRMVHDEGYCTNDLGCVPTDVSVGSLGDIGFVTSPGEMDPAYFLGRPEVTGDYGKQGKKTFPAMAGFGQYMPGRHRIVISGGHNYLSYLVPEGDNVGQLSFKHPQHYEELATIGREFGDRAGNTILRMLGAPATYGVDGQARKAGIDADRKGAADLGIAMSRSGEVVATPENLKRRDALLLRLDKSLRWKELE